MTGKKMKNSLRDPVAFRAKVISCLLDEKLVILKTTSLTRAWCGRCEEAYFLLKRWLG
jgi:hypothetical protein